MSQRTSDSGRLSTAARAIDTWSARRAFFVLVAPLMVLYLATASWSSPYHIDPLTNVLPAWKLGTSGTVELDEHVEFATPEARGVVAWLVPVDDTAVSKYPPGAALVAAPLYAVWPEEAAVVEARASNDEDLVVRDFLLPPLGPAAIAAAAATAAAAGFLMLAFRRIAAPHVAMAGAGIVGLGTAAWPVAADMLWQHGPAMMFLALATWLSGSRMWSAGAAYGASILVRPPTAIVAAVVGLGMGWRERDWRPVVRVAGGALVGLGLLVGYNGLVFESWSISGGYTDVFTENVRSSGIAWYVQNLLGALVSPRRGLLLWSPFLLVLLPGLRAAWRASPGWVRGGALGGVVYLLVTYKANSHVGGGGFSPYRYPLEALVVAAPLLVLSYTEWVARRPRAVRVFGWTVALAVAAMAVFAIA